MIHTIYFTGDTHIPIDIGKLNYRRFRAGKTLTQNDYVIICGDFGGIWNQSHEEEYWLKWLAAKPFTTLFVDGNHENHFLLDNAFPVVSFHGGKAHKINEKLFHLMRGQVFTLNNKKIFTMGGAASHDRAERREHKTWWARELPSSEEYHEALANLNANHWCVDYVVTHCAPGSVQATLHADYEENALTHFLDEILTRLSFQAWYFGHYHIDQNIGARFICLYHTILPADK